MDQIESKIIGEGEINFDSQPLGRGPSRNYVWPGNVLNKRFAFGAPTQTGDTAKELMQNKNHSFLQENEKTLELYKRTHARFESGNKGVWGRQILKNNARRAKKKRL